MPAVFCGFNFYSVNNKEDDESVREFQGIPSSSQFSLISCGPYFEIRTNNDEFEIISRLAKHKEKKVKLASKIKQFLIANEIIYFLLKDSISIYNFSSEDLKTLTTEDNLDQIACTSNTLYGFTTTKVYQVHPHSKVIHEFPSHQRIIKASSGLEHVAILTSNGDLFSFGCGLRGQLGHGDVKYQEIPKLIEALAGIKIIDFSCGSFHTAVISSFGDLYTFGWNTNGQLGLKKAPQGTFNKRDEKMRCQQVFTLPQLIELDLIEDIKSVCCGSKHTIIRTEVSRLFGAGLNNHGQLGIGSRAIDVDEFTEIPYSIEASDVVSCGYFATYILKS